MRTHSLVTRWQKMTAACATAALVAFTTTAAPQGQSFNAGSDGSDGALSLAGNLGTIVFDPNDTRWGKVLDPDGDGVYNFTTIVINLGTTLRLQGDKLNKPVHWLASGDVTINGAIDLTGASGGEPIDLGVRRQVAIPGAGGYAGGAGGFPSLPPTPGEGPGGGAGGVPCSTAPHLCGRAGIFTGNRYLIPLIGGSGGEGGIWDDGHYYGGAAGGGAILIASSTSITIAGTINASGGTGAGAGLGGGGSGGAIRLVAPILSGNGHLIVNGGTTARTSAVAAQGTPGWVRLESFSGGTSFNLDSGITLVTRGSPFDSATLRPSSSIRVTAIDGVAVPQNPSGSFALPDVSINRNSQVSVEIATVGIPPGTVVTLQVYPQSPTDATLVNLPTAQATLTGTLQSSTATASFTFPYGFSRGFVRATWTQ